MAVLIEGTSVVVRVDALLQKVSRRLGGIQAHCPKSDTLR
jgi:hypothetical protein